MVQAWQIQCARCGFANSGSQTRCGKCGRPLKTAPGLLQAGVSAAQRTASTELKAPPIAVAQPGGLLPRFIAKVIDNLILAAIAIPVGFLFASQAQTRTSIHQDTAQALSTQGSILALAIALIALFYYVGSWNILSGSPGMLILNLRVVDSSGKSPGFFRGILRYLFLNLSLSFVGLMVLKQTHLGTDDQQALASVMAPLTGLLFAISVVSVVATKTKRAVHDLVGGTFVIQYLDPAKVLQRQQQLAEKADPTAAPDAAGVAMGAAASSVLVETGKGSAGARPAPPPPPAPAAPTQVPEAPQPYSPPPTSSKAEVYSPPAQPSLPASEAPAAPLPPAPLAPPPLAPPPLAPAPLAPPPLAPPPMAPTPPPVLAEPGSAPVTPEAPPSDPAAPHPMPWEPVPLPPMPDDAPGEGGAKT